MNKKTKTLIETLEVYINENLSRFQKKYPGIIKGIHIGKKRRDEKIVNRYSIVFHVTKKFKHVKDNYKLPEKIAINIPDRGVIDIPTDIVEVGKVELHALNMGDITYYGGYGEYGAVGFFAEKQGEIYLVSNMHTIGSPFLYLGHSKVTYPIQDQELNIVKYDSQDVKFVAYFERGELSNIIDAAIARVDSFVHLDTAIPYFGFPPSGYKTPTTQEIYYGGGFEIEMIGAVSGIKKGRIIARNVAEQFNTILGLKTIYGLLQISPSISEFGDSGSTIHDKYGNIIGIIVGGNSLYSFVLPAETILSRFQLSLLTR